MWHRSILRRTKKTYPQYPVAGLGSGGGAGATIQMSCLSLWLDPDSEKIERKSRGDKGGKTVSGMIAPFMHFSLFFPLFCSLTHTLLSQPVMFLFILIFHHLPRACMCDIQPARQVSFSPSLIMWLITWLLCASHMALYLLIQLLSANQCLCWFLCLSFVGYQTWPMSGLDHTLPTNTVYSPLDLGCPGVGSNRRERRQEQRGRVQENLWD